VDDDGDELVALLRSTASVHDAPPPSFGYADVLEGSRRITRRNRVIAASVVGVVLLGGVGTSVALPLVNREAFSTTIAEAPLTATSVPQPGSAVPGPVAPGSGPGSAQESLPAESAPEAGPDPGPASGPADAAAPAQPAHPAPQPPADPPAPAPGSPAPQPAPSPVDPAPDTGTAPKPHSAPSADRGTPRATPPGRPGPSALGPRDTCGSQQDPELRALVDEVFAPARGAPAAPVTYVCRPQGERAVHVEISDGSKKGVLTVVFSSKAGGTSGDATARTASGGQVSVSVRGDGGPAPYADRMSRLVKDLAPRL